MFNKVIAQIQFEISQIDKLFEAYAELLETVQQRTPTLVELTALGSVVHSFYIDCGATITRQPQMTKEQVTDNLERVTVPIKGRELTEPLP